MISDGSGRGDACDSVNEDDDAQYVVGIGQIDVRERLSQFGKDLCLVATKVREPDYRGERSKFVLRFER
jgi:hypothetical protein